jgi:hypothetical protein
MITPPERLIFSLSVNTTLFGPCPPPSTSVPDAKSTDGFLVEYRRAFNSTLVALITSTQATINIPLPFPAAATMFCLFITRELTRNSAPPFNIRP